MSLVKNMNARKKAGNKAITGSSPAGVAIYLRYASFAIMHRHEGVTAPLPRMHGRTQLQCGTTQ